MFEGIARRRLFLLLLILLSACAVPPTSTAPTITRARTATVPSRAVATQTPPPTVNPVQFDAALRPEFKNDLALIPSASVYSLDLRFENSLDHFTGRESVTFTNREQVPLQSIYFRLFANYPGVGGRITVSGVKVNGVTSTTSLESQDTALRVQLGDSLALGASINVDLELAVTVPTSNSLHYGDFGDSQGIVTLPSVYPLIPAYDQSGWHTELPPTYGDLVYADSSIYDVRVTAPTSTTVVASGVIVDETRTGDETTWHMVGAPMRDFDIDLSRFLTKTSSQVDGVTINSYYLPGDGVPAADVLTWAGNALRVFEKRIGPYPFKKLDIVETPITASGIEYPALIVLARRLYKSPDQRSIFEGVVAHEMAHQWFYSVIGDDQVNTPWVDEAFAQYMSVVYFQDMHNAAAASFMLDRAFKEIYDHLKAQGVDRPVGLPVAAYSEEEYAAFVYGKGPLFLDAVRHQVGDDKFFKFLQTYYQKFKYGVAAPEDIRRALDQISGGSMDALFDKWILGK